MAMGMKILEFLKNKLSYFQEAFFYGHILILFEFLEFVWLATEGSEIGFLFFLLLCRLQSVQNA